MSDMRFTRDHEWIRVEGEIGTVGITDYAQRQLGDVVFIELPAPGRALTQGGEAAVVESVKAASEVYSPVAGTVTDANAALDDKPGLLNEAAESDAWIFRLRLADPGQLAALMDRAAYDDYLHTLE